MGIKLTASAFILIGITCITSSFTWWWISEIIYNILGEIRVLHAPEVVPPLFYDYLSLVTYFAFLHLITGIISVVAGIAILIKPKEKI